MDVLQFSSASAHADISQKQRRSASAAAVFLSALPRDIEDFCGQNEISGLIIFMEKQLKQRGRPFVKGQSGNPAGRPRASKNNPMQAMQLLLAGEAQALTRKAVELALAGDTTALRMCLDRLMVPRRDRVVPLAMRPVRDVGDLAPAMAAIMTAAGRGEISPAEGVSYARLVDIVLKAIDTYDFERRLQDLEKRAAARS